MTHIPKELMPIIPTIDGIMTFSVGQDTLAPEFSVTLPIDIRSYTQSLIDELKIGDQKIYEQIDALSNMIM